MTHSHKSQAGEIVLVFFPFTDLTSHKVRPALVVKDQWDDDLLLLPITSVTQENHTALILEDTSYIGKILPIMSFVRFQKPMTLHQSLISKNFSKLTKKKMNSILHELISFLSR